MCISLVFISSCLFLNPIIIPFRLLKSDSVVTTPGVVSSGVTLATAAVSAVTQLVSSALTSSIEIERDPAKLCYYSGLFYCSRCLWKDKRTIPSHVFLLNSREPKPVSPLLFRQS
ncbi:unnamed protein product [Protopolystoma xenopodis]|uniref:Uncharacterized protein n=1 Tax=Protopolystoma xenopodis TaxID=117903 RepID=A0A448WSK3_9PLAT|nr:unnamed protein product [Protopolystoma xenopodis]